MHSEKKKQVVNFLLENNFLPTDDFLNSITGDFDFNNFKQFIFDLPEKEKESLILDKNLVLDIDKGKLKPEDKSLEKEGNSFKSNLSVKIISSYQDEIKKREIQDFVSYFNMRFNSLKSLLEKRQELLDAVSVNRIINRKDKGEIAFIGLVAEKNTTRQGNIMIKIEDPTGQINTVVTKNKPELYETAKELVEDEVVGVSGAMGNNVVFVNNIVFPDVPLNKELKKCGDDCYAIFLSDLHVGSNNFLPEEFNKFLNWISGKTGNEKQREIAQKVGYIFIVGDMVDGVGVYPEQFSDLSIKDIKEQYKECAELLKKIPSHIKIILCPGNHDVIRIAEPQPVLSEEYAKPLLGMPNVVAVSNPSLINIHSNEDFPGFEVLMYHGYSFDYYVANVDSIREKGGYDRADLIMKFLLQRRHLAPTHTSTLYIPDSKKDPLVIDTIPDFFITGHIHKAAISKYRNVTLISGSCWQSKTDFQEKVGHNPEPARVPLVNLRTREAKMLRF